MVEKTKKNLKKVIPWLKIKAEYLQGVTPKDLAEKYQIKPKQISDKANEEKWVAEKAKISENVRENTEGEIKRLTNKALNALEWVIDDVNARQSDIVSAAKAILDISGLKSSKQEITGKNGEPLALKERLITPDEWKEANKIVDKMIYG